MFKKLCLSLAATFLVGCTGQTLSPVPSLSDEFMTQSQSKIATVSVEHFETIENEVIVKYKSGFSTQATVQLPGTQVLDGFTTQEESTQLMRLPENMEMDEALAFYESDPNVDFAMPNARFEVQMSLSEKITRWWNSDKTQVIPSEEQVETDPSASPSPSPDPSASPKHIVAPNRSQINGCGLQAFTHLRGR